MKNNKKNNTWIYKVFLITFILSIVFGLVSNTIVNNLSVFFAIILLIVIILVGVLFDVIGMAVASTKTQPLHAKASRKYKGAKEALFLTKHADKVSNVCNDVIGDICGVLSGTVCAVIAITISFNFKIDIIVASLIITALTASFTVFGKALGKNYAIKNADKIIYTTGSVLNKFYQVDKNKHKK